MRTFLLLLQMRHERNFVLRQTLIIGGKGQALGGKYADLTEAVDQRDNGIRHSYSISAACVC